MGRGDKKTRKGKIAIGSYGKTRPHQVKKAAPAVALPKAEEPAEAAKPAPAKKPSA